MLKIAHYKMYLKYLIDSYNIKKIAKLKKIKYENINIFWFPFSLSL